MSYKLYITAENKDQWSATLPHFLEDEHKDIMQSGAEIEAYCVGVPYNVVYYKQGSGLGEGGKTTEWERVNENNERVCGFISFLEDENGQYIELDDTRTYITNMGEGFIRYTNEIGRDNNITNFHGTSSHEFGYTEVYGSITEVSYDDAKEIPTLIGVIGGGEGEGYNEKINCKYRLNILCDRIIAKSDLPIFDSIVHAKSYIATGSTVGLLNGKTEDKRPKQYYFEEDIFRLDMAYSNKSQVARIRNYYDTNKENTRLVRYTEENADGYNNVVILGSSRLDNPIIQCRHTPNGTPTDYTLMVFNALNNEWNRKGVDGEITYNNHIYKGNIRTNIPYASSREQAEKYLRNEISINDLPKYKQTGLDVYKREWTGDRADAQDTDISEHIYADGNLVSQYIMTSNQLDSVKDLIYTTETDTLNALKLALSSHGESFISDIIDCYHVPINVEGFVGTSSVSHVPFGLYDSDCSGKKVTTHGKIIELGAVSINGQYGDFRDYECVEMALYLPFCGIMPLPTDVFMNSVLTIKVGADLRAHNLRYYIFVNNESGTSLYSFHDCAFGQNICLMGNDSGSRALTTMQTAFNIQNTQRNLTYNIMNASSQSMQGATNQFMHGNMGGSALSLLNGGTRIAQEIGNARASVSEAKLTQKMTQAQRIFSGSQSSGLSENDILYPYLLFTIQNTNYDGVVDLYGKPSNYFGLLSNCKGFTQCDDVRVNMNIPINEKQMLIDALKEGIIL